MAFKVPRSHPLVVGDVFFCFFVFLRFYSSIHERHRERERQTETQAEGEAGSMQGARRRSGSRDSRIRPWAESGAKPPSYPGCPIFAFLELR